MYFPKRQSTLRLVPIRWENSHGFTLLELLISVTILGVVMVIVVAALRIGIQVWEKGDKKFSGMSTDRAVVELLRRQLHSTFLLQGEEDGRKELFFSGSEDELEYVSLSSAFKWGRTEANLVTYKVAQNDGLKSLMIKERDVPFHGLFDKTRPGDNAAWRTLAKGFKKFSFQYAAAVRHENEIVWHKSWDAKKRPTLPAAVKVLFETASDVSPQEVIIRLQGANS